MPEGVEDRRWLCSLTEQEGQVLSAEKAIADHARKWALFDVFFGFFLVMNALAIGIQSDEGITLDQQTWRQLENVCLLIFSVELILRFFFAGPRLTMTDPWTYFDAV